MIFLKFSGFVILLTVQDASQKINSVKKNIKNLRNIFLNSKIVQSDDTIKFGILSETSERNREAREIYLPGPQRVMDFQKSEI